MFEIIAYLTVSYLVSLALAALLQRFIAGCDTSRRWLRGALRLAMAVTLVAPILPYAAVAFRTYRFKAELLPAVRSACYEVGTDDLVSVRVMRIDGRSAEALAVTRIEDGDYAGDIFWFERKKGRWIYTGRYDTVWSDGGSAHGNTFPPYPSKGDYR